MGWLLTVDLKRRLLQRNGVKLGCDLGKFGWVAGQLEVDGYRNYKMNFKRLSSYFDLARISYIYQLHGDSLWTGGLQVLIGFILSTSTTWRAVRVRKLRQ